MAERLSDARIEERLARIPRRIEEINQKSDEVQGIIQDSLQRNMQLSQSEIVQHAVRYASINHQDFYEFLKKNHQDDQRALEYVSPGAMTLSAERADACLAIGIGVLWLWVVVSPWTTQRTAA